MTRAEKELARDATPLSTRRRQIDCVGESDMASIASRGRGVRESGDDAGRVKEAPSPLPS